MRSRRPAAEKKIADELKDILDVDLAQSTLSVCLASLADDAEMPKVELLSMTEQLAEEFRNIVTRVSSKLKRDSEESELQLRPYDAGSKPEAYELEYIRVADHEPVKSQMSALSELMDLGTFQGNSEFINGLRFYLTVIKPLTGESIYCFRTYSKQKELSRGGKVFAALMSQGQFDRIREPVFIFDQQIDCFGTNGTLFILNPNNFQRIFRFFEMVMRTATETLRIIESHVPISNFADFQQACQGHYQKLAKLRNISQKPYLASITVSDLKKVIRKCNLPIRTVKRNGKEMLVYEPSDKWAILRLLDDDYLHSLMTNRDYEVTGKRLYP